MLAAILGASLALWWLRGDTSGAEFIASATVIEEDTPPTGDIRCYEIRFQDGTAITVMGSSAVPIIRFLKQSKRITVEARSRELERIER